MSDIVPASGADRAPAIPHPSKGPTRFRVTRPKGETRLPRLGKIRLGEQRKSKGGKMYPAALDYFRVVEDESGITSSEAVAAFREEHGDTPRRLRVMLAGHTPEQVFESAYRLYGTSQLKRLCNGVSCSVRDPKAPGGWVDKPCACRAEGFDPDNPPAESSARAKVCQLTHTLWLVLPDVRGFGVWELDTGSEIGERAMRDYLDHVYGIRGTLMAWEFDIELAAVKVAPVTVDDAGTVSATTKTVRAIKPVPRFDVTPRQVLENAGRSGVAMQPAGELPAPVLDEKRDELVSPTPAEQAEAEAAAVDELPLERAIVAGFQALSPPEQAELVELVAGEGSETMSAGLLMERYGDDARDIPALLARLRSDARTPPSGEADASSGEQLTVGDGGDG